MAHAVRSLSPLWETQTEFPAPGFGLSQPLLWTFGNQKFITSRWEIPSSVSNSFKQIRQRSKSSPHY